MCLHVSRLLSAFVAAVPRGRLTRPRQPRTYNRPPNAPVMRNALRVGAIVIAVSIAPVAMDLDAERLDALQQSGPVTFASDIAPIVFEHCVSCHRSGGSAPFSLLSYEDVKMHAERIAAVTQSRYMPPWKPEPGYGDFADARRLSQPQIELIRRWVAGGAPLGDPSLMPPSPKVGDQWQLGSPD